MPGPATSGPTAVGWPTPKIVPIPGQPGMTIDQRILSDVLNLIAKFKVKVTAGYAPTGHKAGGEHPHGLAVDLVPDTARGGTWADVTRLAHEAEPTQNNPTGPFRWVGYEGDPGHGPGDHLHLSWAHQGTHVSTVSNTQGGGVDLAGIAKGAVGVGKAIVEPPGKGDPFYDLGHKAGKAAEDAALAPVKAVINALAPEGARILLYLVLILGGAALALYGFARATGTEEEVGSTVKTAAAAAVVPK